jgi:lysophospholipase L1-like esterase
MTNKKRPKRYFYLILMLVPIAATAIIATTAELISRSLEPRSSEDIKQLTHPHLGWLPSPGEYKAFNSEFSTSISVNSLSMNDREITAPDLNRDNRILALGDSHTFAVGASTNESWPKRLEERLFPDRKAGVIWNGAVSGYSVGQYLVRFRGLKGLLRPTLVVVGFSMATDLYDLIPPERGGFVYGGDASRVYFDLGPDGEVIEKVHRSTPRDASTMPPGQRDISLRIREVLGEFSLFRRLKRSNLAMWIAVHRPGGVSLWPGLDTALKRQLSEDDEYRWLLAERILDKLVTEAREAGAQVAVVNIPYLAQVYDTTWSVSFGSRPSVYDRWIAGERLRALCQRIGAIYIDTTAEFVATARSMKRWLHWPQDAHPTPEGQDLIATVVADNLLRYQLVSRGH